MPEIGCLRPRHISSWVILGALFGLPGCYVRQADYVSPFNGITGEYHTLPTVKDSIRSAIYAHGLFVTGSANDNFTDHLNSFTGGIYAAHHVGILQFYYGGSGTLGGFYLGKWDTTQPIPSPPSSMPVLFRGVPSGPPATSVALNSYSKGYFFGGATFSGGLNLVIPFKDGEWRILGVEVSTTHEFGKYLSLRKKMPDSIASLIIRDNAYTTYGFTSEILGHTRHGEFGFRGAIGQAIGNNYENSGVRNNATGYSLKYIYFAGSFHYTYGQYTGYLQANKATKAIDLLVGMNYRLWAGRKKKPAP